MKTYCLVALLIVPFFGFSQKIEKYYDYLWHETVANYARFYSLIEKTDSGWRRRDYFIHEGGSLQKEGYCDDSTCKMATGPYLTLYPNKKMESYGRYLHNKKQGLWIRFYPDGAPLDSTVYDQGKPMGVSIGWSHNGYISDSAVHSPDGSGVQVSWFDNGNPSSFGLLAPGAQKNSQWKYFHKNGKPSAIEIYDHGKMTDKQYYDEAGEPMADTTNNDKPATFPGGLEAWKNYLGNHLDFPLNIRISNSDMAAVVITWSVDEDGRVQDAYVSIPFYPEFEKIALRVIRNSPRWIPARDHNRTIKAVLRQPVVFAQP